MRLSLPLEDESQNQLINLLLEDARNIICEIRNTLTVEEIYKSTQVKIAIELYNKQGVEGQTTHIENGITRVYEKADISPSLLDEITPRAKTPFSVRG